MNRCATCGGEIPPREPGKRGRNADYCCDECRDFHTLEKRFASYLGKTILRMRAAGEEGRERAAVLHRLCWQWANKLNAVGRPVKPPEMPQREAGDKRKDSRHG